MNEQNNRPAGENSNGNPGGMLRPVSENPVYPVIPVADAEAATRRWREFNEEIQKKFDLPETYLDEYIRAFFIPASDLQAINDMIQADPQITGARVYLGIEEVGPGQNVVGAEVKLFIVGVQGLNPPGAPGTGIDIVVAPDSGKSLVYDFTCPCPSTCDVSSVLYRDQS